MHFFFAHAWLTRLTRGNWTCRWLAVLCMHMLTDWNIEKADLYIFSTEFCHKTNMFVIRSWSGFHVSVQSNSYLLLHCIATLHDWLQTLSSNQKEKPKPIVTRLLEFFPRLASATCICFELWLVHWFLCVLCLCIVAFHGCVIYINGRQTCW